MHHTESIIAYVLDTANRKYRKFSNNNAQKLLWLLFTRLSLFFFFSLLVVLLAIIFPPYIFCICDLWVLTIIPACLRASHQKSKLS